MEVINIILNFKAFDDAHKAQYHRRRKILKVEGAKDTIAREFFDHAHFGSNHADFCTIEVTVQCSQELLDERTNSKSSRVDLAATYSHIYL